ncbi:MAG: hypothetical protein PHF11_03205, partial [Candidatus Omnitrophica bacterium]|nr:hypothetical protein [Candidatus Omnitrophota bacterium]
KTLEEPPPFVKFIFATTHPEKIPATVISRCQRLDFRRISLMEIIAQLEKICRQENIDIDREVFFAIAKSSEGSLRDAESMLDQLVSFSRGRVCLKDINSVFGLITQDALFDITEKIIRKDPKAALGLLNDIIEQGKDVGIFLANLTEHFRNLMIAKVSQADAGLIDLPKDICERLLQQAGQMGLDEIFSAFNTLVNTREMSKRLESMRIPLEIALVKLTQDKRGASLSHPAPKYGAQAKPESAKEDKQAGPAANDPEPPAAAQACVSESIAVENIKQSWQAIIDSLAKVKMSLATYLTEGNPLKLENNILTIAFPKNYSLHKECLESKDNRLILEKTFSEFLHNTRLRIHFILTQEAAPRNEPENPLLKTALKMFGGRVIKEE